MREKSLSYVVFCLLVCVFAGWFWFDLHLCTLKIFPKKNRLAWNCLNSLIYSTTNFPIKSDPILLFLMYSQTCSTTCNYHLYKTTTRLRWRMLSLPKQIPIQLLLRRPPVEPVTTLFVSQMKNNLSKTTTKNFTQRRNGKQTRRHCIKDKYLSDYIYCGAIL